MSAAYGVVPEPGPAERDVPAPLSRGRVAGALAELDYPAFVDRHGTLGVLWPEASVHVHLLGPGGTVLQVRGRWHRRLAIERHPEVLGLLEEWNRRYVGPKCYVRVQDDGRLAVVSESAVSLSAGVSTDQLVHHLRRAVAQAVRVVRDLEAHYPDPAGQAP